MQFFRHTLPSAGRPAAIVGLALALVSVLASLEMLAGVPASVRSDPMYGTMDKTVTGKSAAKDRRKARLERRKATANMTAAERRQERLERRLKNR